MKIRRTLTKLVVAAIAAGTLALGAAVVTAHVDVASIVQDM